MAKGQLTLFFTYYPNDGAVCTMLRAARRERERGKDVVIGCLREKPEGELRQLLFGMEILESGADREMDLDAVIKRNPGLLVTEDLPHLNPPNSRHNSRYHDIRELLSRGVDVYATLDVCQIESLSDIVSEILEEPVENGLPDSVFDHAERVEWVDVPPQKLCRDLSRRGGPSVTLESLEALRKVALRRQEERQARRMEQEMHPGSRVGEHILVCLSSAPSNPKIVRTGARMAAAFGSRFTALFVRTPDFDSMSGENKERLRKSMNLAQRLGASVETTYGEDVPYQIAEFARLFGVTKIVLGRSNTKRRYLWSKPPLNEALTSLAPNLDIYIIPDSSVPNGYPHSRLKKDGGFSLSGRDIAKTAGILTAATLIGFVFYHLGFSEANIITVYLLGVLLTSIFTAGWLCSLFASVVSVLVFGYFFTVPRFAFAVADKEYPVTFAIMFLAAILTGTLAARLKDHARESARTAFRSRVLFETSQLLQNLAEEDDIFCKTGQQLARLLKKDVCVYTKEEDTLARPRLFPPESEGGDGRWLKMPAEREAALWAFHNNKRAGAMTDTFSGARGLYLAVRAEETVYGVVGICLDQSPLEAFEYSMVLSVLGECALVLENRRIAREKEQAALAVQSERLRANLLRSISHDLRTPLTSISGNASNLMSNGEKMDEMSKSQIYRDIYEDSVWLINLVENLLAVTRIEEGRMHLKQSTELADEIISEALLHVKQRSKEHVITVQEDEELLFVRADGRLIVQVLVNLVDNALKYTPPGSHIRIHVEKKAETAVFFVEDDGPGIPDSQKSHIFDMFYTGSNEIADSRRSIGLGLFLCRSIIAAHGGEMTVSDVVPHGAIFSFTLPCGEVDIHG